MALPPLKIVPDDEALAARGLGLYLQAKQLANRRHCDLAAKPMARSLELGLPDNDFVIEARLTLARCHHRLGRLAPAAAVLSTLLKSELPGGMALMVRDWAQRVRWESGDPL